MTRRRRIEFGLTALAALIVVGVSACTNAPLGRT